MRPDHLECSACGKRHQPRLINLCDCGAPLLARYDLAKVRRQDLGPRRDLWRYGALLPLEDAEIQSRGEGGTPLLRLTRLGSGGDGSGPRVGALYLKDEGRNPTGTFKARGMAVAVPMARCYGAKAVIAPTAGNAGAALALYAATYGLDATILMTLDAPPDAVRDAVTHGARVLHVDGDITEAGRIARGIAEAAGAFSLATLQEPYRVEGKKTMLYEIWEDLGGMPDWILFPTGGGTGIVGIWKALGELRSLGWYEGAWPRLAVVQAEGCAPLVKAWRERKDHADPWPHPTTRAAGLRVPATLADRMVLRALRETDGVGVDVTEEGISRAAADLATTEGVSACLEGAATLAGLRRLCDEGVIGSRDKVVLVNTGSARGMEPPSRSALPTVRTAADAIAKLGLTSRAS